MIIFDTPKEYRFRGRRIRSSHLVSTLLGDVGTEQLLAFADQIGLRPQWLQNKGTPSEHFDLFNTKICAATKHGAQPVADRTLAAVLRQKADAVGTRAAIPKQKEPAVSDGSIADCGLEP